MPTVDINLNEVVEKPRLPAGQALPLGIMQATLEMSKTVNKNTGKIEPLVKAILYCTDPEWADRKIYQNWSMAPGALSSDDPTFSIKKFFAIVGFKYNSDGTFSTEDLSTIQFVGTIKYQADSNFPNLATVLRGV